MADYVKRSGLFNPATDSFGYCAHVATVDSAAGESRPSPEPPALEPDLTPALRRALRGPLTGKLDSSGFGIDICYKVRDTRATRERP